MSKQTPAIQIGNYNAQILKQRKLSQVVDNYSNENSKEKIIERINLSLAHINATVNTPDEKSDTQKRAEKADTLPNGDDEDFNKETREKLKTKKSVISGAPKYFKPSFLLDKLSPLLKIWWRIRMDDGSYKNVPIFENYGESQKNYIKGMTYSQATRDVKIDFVDPKGDFIEMLQLQFLTVDKLSSVVYFEIEYGWATPKNHLKRDLIREELDDNVFFTNTLYVVLINVEHNYRADGVIEGTLSCQVEQSLPIPYDNLCPNAILGPMPAVTIVIKDFIMIFKDYVFKGIDGDSTSVSPSSRATQIKTFAKICKEEKGIANPDTIKDIFQAAVKYFIKRGKGQEKWLTYIEKNKSFFVLSNPTKKGSKTEESTLSGPWQSNMRKIINEKGNFYKQFQREVTNPNNKEFIEFIKVLGPVAQECRIHPAYVYEEAFEKLKDMILKPNKYGIDFSFSGAPSLLIFDKLDEDFIMPRSGTKTSSGQTEYTNVLKSEAGVTIADREKYYEKAGAFNVTPATTWDQYINNVCSKMYVDYQFESKQEAKHLGADESQFKNGRAPMKCVGNMFLCSNQMAKKNLERYRVLLNRKLDFLEQNGSPSRLVNSTKIELERINQAWGETNASNDILMFFRDVAATGEFFNPFVGNNKILQAYSDRTSTTFDDGQYNPGMPTCWDVNYPDVLSFDPEDFSFYESVQHLVTNARMKTEGYSIEASDVGNRLADLENEIMALGKGSKNTEDMNRIAGELNSIKSQLDSYNPLIEAYQKNNPISFNLNEYSEKIYAGQYANVLETKKKNQTMRNRLLLESLNINASLKVIGDASFSVFDTADSYIFYKKILPDGQLSFFTGIYIIQDIIQTVSSSSFLTELKISKDATAGDADLTSQFYAMATEMDRVIIRGNNL